MTQKLLTFTHTNYYAVIFTSLKTETAANDSAYATANDTLEIEAKSIPGFLGMESVRDGIGISISYWKDAESIELWRKNLNHVAAKNKGFSSWYQSFTLRICKVEHQRNFEK